VQESDIPNPNRITTDFSNMVVRPNNVSGTTVNDVDSWHADALPGTGVPDAVTNGHPWTASNDILPWQYSLGPDTGGINGHDNVRGKQGLLTRERGARLLYNPSIAVGDLHMQITFSPEKAQAQGFGSATSQWMDFFFKYDPITRTGYSLRFSREATDWNALATRATLLYHNQGVSTPMSFEGNAVTTTVYLAGLEDYVTAKISVVDDVVSIQVDTPTPQLDVHLDFIAANNYPLAHSIDWTYKLTQPNTFGGFGFMYTSTVTNGNRTMLHTLDVSFAPAP
jgi:hypothetical protein